MLRTLKIDHLKSIAGGMVLIALNFLLVYLFSYTFVPKLVSSMFSSLLVGILVVAGVLTVGGVLAEGGVIFESIPMAFSGLLMLQLMYGALGAKIISVLSGGRVVVILVSGLITLSLSMVLGIYVFVTTGDKKKFRTFSRVSFLAAFIFSIVGSFTGLWAILFYPITFLLTSIGFVSLLIFKIWRLKSEEDNVIFNAIGLYTAFMGVFLHVLRIVVEYYGRNK